MSGGKEYKASRLGGLERVRGGEKGIIRARERKEEKPICSSRLSRSCLALSRAYKSCFAWRWFLTESIVVSVSICEIAYTVSQETFHAFQHSVVGEPTTTTTEGAMNKNQTLLEMNAAIAAIFDSNWSYVSAPLYMKGFFTDGIIRCPLYDDFLWPHIPHACL